MPNRIGSAERNTKETNIRVELKLDEPGCVISISAGAEKTARFQEENISPDMVVHFLEQLHAWSGIGGNIVVEGRDFSSHHSLEDMAICWGDAFRSALGDKKGITRVASASMPMQGVLVTMSLDLSGRPFLTWITGIKSPMVEMLHHILHDMATHGAFDLNARLEYEGNNAIEDEHHLIETAGKTLGRVLREALEIKGTEIRSTKGVLS